MGLTPLFTQHPVKPEVETMKMPNNPSNWPDLLELLQKLVARRYAAGGRAALHFYGGSTYRLWRRWLEKDAS